MAQIRQARMVELKFRPCQTHAEYCSGRATKIGTHCDPLTMKKGLLGPELTVKLPGTEIAIQAVLLRIEDERLLTIMEKHGLLCNNICIASPGKVLHEALAEIGSILGVRITPIGQIVHQKRFVGKAAEAARFEPAALKEFTFDELLLADDSVKADMKKFKDEFDTFQNELGKMKLSELRGRIYGPDNTFGLLVQVQ